MKDYNFFSVSWGIILGCGMVIVMTAILFMTGACDISTQDQIDMESEQWEFLGDSRLIKATSIFDENGYWEHWYLEFENGVVLNTKEWETKPFWVGKVYGIYYRSNNRRVFLEMK